VLCKQVWRAVRLTPRCFLCHAGLESIPNIDFWREFFFLVGVGVSRSIAFVRCQPWHNEGDHGTLVVLLSL